jgi:hypothetical protein
VNQLNCVFATTSGGWKGKWEVVGIFRASGLCYSGRYPSSLLSLRRSRSSSLHRRSTNTNTIQPNHYALDHLPQSPNEIKYIVPGRFVDDFEIMSTMSMKDFFFETPS